VSFVFFGMAFGALLWGGAALAPLYAGPRGWLAFAALWTTGIPGACFAARIGVNPVSAALVPLGFPLMGISLLNSTWKTLWQGGVRWRDTFYPLATLRAGCVDWRPRMRLTPRDPT
jgi:hypothetical protein